MSNKLEWRINVPDGTQETMVPKPGLVERPWLGLEGLLREFVLKIWNFFEKAWSIAVGEPKKVIHGLKVGLALTIVSVIFYIRPLYEGVGDNAVWAIMTVVVVYEYTANATLCKCINRVIGTFLAGSLGVGVHWVARKSGDPVEPIILGISVFIFWKRTSAAATFSRFMPSVKARFNYGAMIFILTFIFVSVSGYRVEKLFEIAHQRLSTIAIGTSICIMTSMLCCPIWAGDELHNLIHQNLEKLADSLDGCVAGYFTSNSNEDYSKKMERYKCVLNSKATEDSMANFARWEPAHGRFNKQYLNIGASLRSCAYCIETLNGCISSEIQAPESLKKHLSGVCLTFSSPASNVLKKLVITMMTMKKSSKIDLFVEEMQFAAEELQKALKSLPNHHLSSDPSSSSSTPSGDPRPEVITKKTIPPIMKVLPLETLVSLLIETASRIEDIVDTVSELATLADFKPADDGKANHDQPCNRLILPNEEDQAMKTPSKL